MKSFKMMFSILKIKGVDLLNHHTFVRICCLSLVNSLCTVHIAVITKSHIIQCLEILKVRSYVWVRCININYNPMTNECTCTSL